MTHQLIRCLCRQTAQHVLRLLCAADNMLISRHAAAGTAPRRCPEPWHGFSTYTTQHISRPFLSALQRLVSVPPPRASVSISLPGSRAACVCSASKQTEVGGYTPADYIVFSDNPELWCQHEVAVSIDAPVETCFEFWNDWQKLLDFLDLIGQIGLDSENPDLALFTCYYRWATLPVMEIVFVLSKTEVKENQYIRFKSEWGMPCQGCVAFGEEEDGRTRVEFIFRHAMPDLLLQLRIGSFGVVNSMIPIWDENMEMLKQAAEAARPANWEQLKPAAAERGKAIAGQLAEIRKQLIEEAQQPLEQSLEQHQVMQEVEGPGGAPAATVDQQGGPEGTSTSASTQAAAPAPAPAPAAAKRRTSTSARSSRKTSSASTAAAGSSSSSEGGAQGAQPPAAAGTRATLKSRGRTTRSASPTEQELAAAAAQPSSPTPRARSRRSTTASKGSGAAAGSSDSAAAAGSGSSSSSSGPPRTSSRKTSAS